MSEHLKRMRDIFHLALPDEGSPEFEKIKKHYEQDIDSPTFKEDFKKRHTKALNTLLVQDKSGINLGIDQDTRYYMREFNYRLWQYGIRTMPLMFNIMEAFFHYDKSILLFELLEEEDYRLSFFDFLDFYTSPEFDGDVSILKKNIEENIIYNFHLVESLDEISFKTNEGKEFVISGISLVRRNDEITILLLCGEVTDTSLETKRLLEAPVGNPVPGKEKLKVDDHWETEAVKLNGNANHWKHLIACRFDLTSKTIDGRYVAADVGHGFDVKSDEIEGYLNSKGQFLSADIERFFKGAIDDLNTYDAIFDVARAVIFMPFYFNQFESLITKEDHITSYSDLSKSPIESRKFKNVENKFKVRLRPLWILDRNKKISSDKIIIKDEHFKIESSGYWKKLAPNEHGLDKSGNTITGKTWVVRNESYYQAESKDLIIEKSNIQQYEGPNAGYIYMVRNPTFPTNTFKIGLTTKETKSRIGQLSNTSVADKFYLFNEWAVKNCHAAETEIHRLLKDFRIDPRREFFTGDSNKMVAIIQEVIERINF